VDEKSSQLALIRSYLDALERFAPVEEIGAFLHPEAELGELPHRFAPDGVIRDRATFLATTAKLAALFSSQQYLVRNAVIDGSCAAIEAEWQATLSEAARADARARGAQTLKAFFAIFFVFRGGQIISQRNYNCYPPG
jgi:ketosteroid isomerase-like protein